MQQQNDTNSASVIETSKGHLDKIRGNQDFTFDVKQPICMYV